MPDMQPVNQLEIELSIRRADGEPLRFTYLHTFNYVPDERFDESLLSRPEPALVLDPELEARLRRGLAMDISSPDQQAGYDAVVLRMAAWQMGMNESLPMLMKQNTTETRMLCTLYGWLQVDLTDEYEFRLDASEYAILKVNGEKPIESGVGLTRSTTTLRQGWNEVSIDLFSTGFSNGDLRVLWRGPGFDWEPLPPDRLWHDPETPALVESTQLREGHALVRKPQVFSLSRRPERVIVGMGSRSRRAGSARHR